LFPHTDNFPLRLSLRLGLRLGDSTAPLLLLLGLLSQFPVVVGPEVPRGVVNIGLSSVPRRVVSVEASPLLGRDDNESDG